MSGPRILLFVLALAANPSRGAAPLDFSLPRLGGGAAVRLADYRGAPVVVDFWATWCEPCKASLPEHEKLAHEFEGRAAVVTISVDEEDAPVLRFMERRQLHLAVGRDPAGTTAAAFGVTAMPYAVVLDGRGGVVERVEGEPYPALRKALERAVLASVPAPKSLAPGCAGLVSREATAMGTRIRLAICPGAAGATEAQAATEASLEEFKRLEALWTTWSKDSDISRANANAGKAPVTVSPETFEVLTRANAGSALSNGLFDVTFAPLGELWKFDHAPESHVEVKLERVPTAAEVRVRRALVDWHQLKLDPLARTVLLMKEGMSLHLGGIGKGAAVDRVVALLRARGFKDFTVQAGGDLFCAGKNGERPWRVGIAHPREKGRIVGSLDVIDAAFSTSGDYERFTIIDGVRYHHIIDPRTGYPATASQSVTVLAPSATDAEILTKTAFILGDEEGLAALARAQARGVIINAAGTMSVSPGLPLVKP